MIYCDAFEGVQGTALVFQTAGRQNSPHGHSQSIGTHRLHFICSRWSYLNICQSNSCARNCLAARKAHSHIGRWRSLYVSIRDILYLHCGWLHTTTWRTVLLIPNNNTKLWWLELATFTNLGVSLSWVRFPELSNLVTTHSLPKDEILITYPIDSI